MYFLLHPFLLKLDNTICIVNFHSQVICSDHANSCFNVSTENIEDEFLTEAEACFCEGDL